MTEHSSKYLAGDPVLCDFHTYCPCFHTMSTACSLLLIAELENMLQEEKGQP